MSQKPSNLAEENIHSLPGLPGVNDPQISDPKLSEDFFTQIAEDFYKAYPQDKPAKKLHPELRKIIEPRATWMENGYATTSSFLLKETWKRLKRNWGHSLHAMASRSGSFPPSLADYFIQKFSKKSSKILDPFSGKGTTALQACLNDRTGIGIDITPEAYILTAAKTVKIPHNKAVKYLEELDAEHKFSLDKLFDSKKSKKTNKRADSRKITSKFLKGIPKEVKTFYHDKTLAQIIAFKQALENDYSMADVSYLLEENPHHETCKKNFRLRAAQYWMGVMMGILHGSSEISLSLACSHSFSMSPGYVEKYAKKHGLEKPIRDLKTCLIERSARLFQDEDHPGQGRSILGSAMDMPKSLTDTVDLIVTSPPYFTAQTYAWDNWLREWFLGFNFKEVRTKTLHTNVEKKYAEGMFEYLRESYRVMRKKTWSFVVVGDIVKKINSGKDKKHIVTAEIIAEEAQKVGFSVELIINDDIPPTSRYNSAFLKQGQGLKLDRIVCLYKS